MDAPVTAQDFNEWVRLMGYRPPDPPPPRLNLDRFGMPRDFTTYMWVLYRRRVSDDSPGRRAFEGRDLPNFGQQISMR